MNKRITPYQRLLESFRQFANEVEFRRRITMWRYPKSRLNEAWNLADLFERVAAAEQLGFDVRLRAQDDGLLVEYIKKAPERPWEVRL